MTPQEQEALELLGRRIIREVFDATFDYLDGVIACGMKGRKPDPLHESYRQLDEESARMVRRFASTAVDQTLARFLYFLDEHQIPLPVELPDGQIVDVQGVSDGLAAEPYSEEGWIAKFSLYKNGL
jgi:hypothetical protein